MQTRALGNALSSAGLLVIAALVYCPSTLALWNWWTDDNHAGAHGLLVAPLAAALLFRARHRLNALPAQPSGLACVLLLLCSLAWLIFWRAGIQELHLLLLPVLMGLSICALLGFRAVPVIAFPLGFLYFAVPAWGIFIGPLQQLTVAVVGFFAPFVGVQEHIQGDLVIMPGVGIIEIAGSCSGANFFCIGLAIGALLGELEDATLLRRVTLLAAMGIMAAVSNWVRVLIIVEAGYSTHMRHVLITRGHYTFGWVLFATVMVACIWLLARPPTGPEQGRSEPRPAAMVARLSAYAFAILALVVAPLAVYFVVGSIDSTAAPVAFAAPLGRAGWVGPVGGGGAWQPDFVGPHSQWSVAYTGPAGHNVDMVAIGYSSQAQGRELVNEENSLFGASSFTPTAEDKVTLGADSYIETTATDAQGRRSLVWSVYDIGGRRFVTPLLSQLWYGLRSLGGSPVSVLFAVRTTCDSSCDSARATLRSFVQTMGPDLFASITRVPRSSHAAGRV